MQVDYVLILAAGKGTRMGSIGKILPKVIWPVFNKSLLELQVRYANKFNPSKIFINLFNNKDQILDHIEKSDVFNSIEVLIEDKKMDIGGAIHNLAKTVEYKGRLLVINADQFLMFNEETKENIFLDDDFDVKLLTYKVKKSQGYNQVLSNKGDFIEVKPNSGVNEEEFETYCGVSLIKLESLDKIEGESRFFESVVNTEKQKVKTVSIGNSLYWDFGTVSRYYDSMFKICNDIYKNNIDLFLNFLLKEKALEKEKISESSYNSDMENVIDLANNVHAENSIYLSQVDTKSNTQKSVHYKNAVNFV